MITISLYIELYIAGTHSLKEKRHVLRSIKDHLRSKFNISLREVAYQDKWQRAGLGIAIVHYDRTKARQIVDSISRTIIEKWGIDIIKKEIKEW